MNISFRYKFLLSFVLLEFIFLSLILYSNTNFINNSSYKLIETRLDTIKSLSSKLLLVPVSIHDIDTIDTIIQGIIEFKSIKKMNVVDKSGLKLSQYGESDNLTDLFYIKLPLISGEIKVGDVNIWIDINKDYEVIKQYRNFMYKIITIEILISLILAYFLGYRLSKNLEKLKLDAENLGNDENYKIEIIRSNDEIEFLSKSMKSMQEKFKDRTIKLRELNENLDNKVKEELSKNHFKDKLLNEQTKLASMAEMIGNIAHQWRQPLSIISSCATGLMVQNENKIVTEESIEKNCKQINKNAQYLSNTIDDFTSFIDNNQTKSTFQVSEMINTYEELINPIVISHNINFIVNIIDDIKLESHQNEIIQCMINIFNNSKDTFESKNIESKYIFLDITFSKNCLILDFKDNALGVDENILIKIYEPYFTTKHQSMGTGLGLSIVHNIVTNGLGGKVGSQNLEFEYANLKLKGLNTIIIIPIS